MDICNGHDVGSPCCGIQEVIAVALTADRVFVLHLLCDLVCYTVNLFSRNCATKCKSFFHQADEVHKYKYLRRNNHLPKTVIKSTLRNELTVMVEK